MSEFAVHNPHGRPLDELPVIYGFNNGGSAGLLIGQLVSEDGFGMGSHGCSHEGFMPGDLGCLDGTRPDRHDGFREKFPDGYRMEFVPSAALDSHAGLQAAFVKARAVYAEETKEPAA